MRRPMNNQRHMQGALINEKTMRGLAVVSQSLSMVRGKDDERLVHQVMSSEIVPEIANHVIDITQLSAIALAIFRLFRSGQVIGRVQVVDVKEQKKRPIRMRVKPRFAGLGDCFTFSLDVSWIAAVAVQRCRRAVIGVESLVQSEAPVEHETAKECGCLIAMRPSVPASVTVPGARRSPLSSTPLTNG